ncbi:MAG: DNA adenine methylase [Clostridia bacterium]|nr:DNA adenine methylase [Clostridia bacterium]
MENKRNELTQDDFIQNIECAFKSAFYMHFRYLYNNAKELNISKPFYIAIYFYIREFCYSSMFRYNANGHFNVPYGGISYNKKSLKRKIEYFSSSELVSHLKKTTMGCLDFEDFLEKKPPNENDFMFLDPPYDTEFSTYANNAFDKKDQERLANYLKSKCDCYFMLVIKKSDFILQLYKNGELTKNGRKIRIEKFDKKYFVSFQNRNNKCAEHLVITNY